MLGSDADVRDGTPPRPWRDVTVAQHTTGMIKGSSPTNELANLPSILVLFGTLETPPLQGDA